MRGISWLVENQLAPQEGLCSMQKVSKEMYSSIYKHGGRQWSALSWDFTELRAVVSYRRFETTYQSHLQGCWTAWPLKMGPIGCTERSVTRYQSMLHKIPERRISHVHWGISLLSQTSTTLHVITLQETEFLSLPWKTPRCKTNLLIQE